MTFLNNIASLFNRISQSALASITMYHRMGAETTKICVLAVLEAGSPRVRPAWLGSGEDPFAALRRVPFSLCTWRRDRQNKVSGDSSNKTTNPISGPCPHDFI